MRLFQARNILDATLARARAAGSRPVVVVLTDAGGSVIASAREDNAGNARHDLSTSKARSALALGMSTRTLASFFLANGALHEVLRSATGSDLLPVVGGVLVRDSEGRTIGAAGISGGDLAEEESFLTGGIADAGLHTDP